MKNKTIFFKKWPSTGHPSGLLPSPYTIGSHLVPSFKHKAPKIGITNIQDPMAIFPIIVNFVT